MQCGVQWDIAPILPAQTQSTKAMLTVLLGFMACWGGDLTNHATKKQELQSYMLFVNIQW
jgi:hypothetical protein